MYRTFSGAINFNQDISIWDVGNVTSMERMFNGASNFNQNLTLWNTSNVKNMSYMFSNANSFYQPQIQYWNISPDNIVLYMFSNTNNEMINVININNINSTKNPSISWFVGSSYYPTLTKTSLDIVKLITYETIIYTTSLLLEGEEYYIAKNKEDLKNLLVEVSGNKIVTSLVTNMSELLEDINTIYNENINNWDTTNVTSMESMFKDCLIYN